MKLLSLAIASLLASFAFCSIDALIKNIPGPKKLAASAAKKAIFATVGALYDYAHKNYAEIYKFKDVKGEGKGVFICADNLEITVNTDITERVRTHHGYVSQSKKIEPVTIYDGYCAKLFEYTPYSKDQVDFKRVLGYSIKVKFSPDKLSFVYYLKYIKDGYLSDVNEQYLYRPVVGDDSNCYEVMAKGYDHLTWQRDNFIYSAFKYTTGTETVFNVMKQLIDKGGYFTSSNDKLVNVPGKITPTTTPLKDDGYCCVM